MQTHSVVDGTTVSTFTPSTGIPESLHYCTQVPKERTHAYDPSHALDLDDASKMNQMHEAPLLDLLLRRFRKVGFVLGEVFGRMAALVVVDSWIACERPTATGITQFSYPRPPVFRVELPMLPVVRSETTKFSQAPSQQQSWATRVHAAPSRSALSLFCSKGLLP